MFKWAKKVTLKNITNVNFKIGLEVYWSEGKREFVLENCGVEKLNEYIFQNGTSFSKFSKIEILNSTIERLDSHTFNNTEIDDFTITDSKINAIANASFDMTVQQHLTFSRNTVEEMHANSFVALKANPDLTIRIEGNDMKRLLSQKFNLNFDSSMNNVTLSKVKFTKNYINHDCECDLFEAFEGHHEREELKKHIYGKLILSFECNYNSRHYDWITFDELVCADEHGHGEHGHEDKKNQGFFESKYSSQNCIDVKDDLIIPE